MRARPGGRESSTDPPGRPVSKARAGTVETMTDVDAGLRPVPPYEPPASVVVPPEDGSTGVLESRGSEQGAFREVAVEATAPAEDP